MTWKKNVTKEAYLCYVVLTTFVYLGLLFLLVKRKKKKLRAHDATTGKMSLASEKCRCTQEYQTALNSLEAYSVLGVLLAIGALVGYCWLFV